MRQIIALLIMLCVPSLSQATILLTEEWETRPGFPWSYSTPSVPAVDCAVSPASPSGGCALHFVIPAGTYPSSADGGTATYEFLATQPQDLYMGHWSFYSSSYTFNLIANKIAQFALADLGSSNAHSNVQFGWDDPSVNLGYANQINWGSGTQVRFCNMTPFSGLDLRNQWFWIEMHVHLNTPGVANGILDIWINNSQCAHFTDVPIADGGVSPSSGWQNVQHANVWGGGGGTISQTNHWWVDHTVLSTSRIGMPGGAQDMTPPAVPTGVTVTILVWLLLSGGLYGSLLATRALQSRVPLELPHADSATLRTVAVQRTPDGSDAEHAVALADRQRHSAVRMLDPHQTDADVHAETKDAD